MASLKRTAYVVKYKNGHYWARRGRKAKDFASASIIQTYAIASQIYRGHRRQKAIIVPVTVTA